jgi:hypothetical protein
MYETQEASSGRKNTGVLSIELILSLFLGRIPRQTAAGSGCLASY